MVLKGDFCWSWLLIERGLPKGESMSKSLHEFMCLWPFMKKFDFVSFSVLVFSGVLLNSVWIYFIPFMSELTFFYWLFCRYLPPKLLRNLLVLVLLAKPKII